jgi:hypothetical protein
MGAMKVDVSAVGIRVVFVQAFEPKNPAEDCVLTLLTFPHSSWNAAFKVGEDGGSLANALANYEVSDWSSVGSLFNPRTIGRGGDRGFKDFLLVPDQNDLLSIE